MAKLVLLLVFVCFQFSRSEELGTAEQGLNAEDEIPFNIQTGPDTETAEQVKQELNTEDEIPFNIQTGPDTEILDGADENQWYKKPMFDYDWANQKWPDYSDLFNDTGLNADKLGMDYGNMYDNYGWGAGKDGYPDYITEDNNFIINNNGEVYTLSSVTTLSKVGKMGEKPKTGLSLGAGKLEQKWKGGKAPFAKRFTSL